jgi:hypothetical protein
MATKTITAEVGNFFGRNGKLNFAEPPTILEIPLINSETLIG